MSERHTRLAAALAASWEEELLTSQRFSHLAERFANPSARARLMVMSSFCRAHASRLLARLAAMGRGPLPVPSEIREGDALSIRVAVQFEKMALKAHAIRYQQMAEEARIKADLSSAWVCELNLRAALDMAAEMDGLVEEELSPLTSHVPSPGG